MSSYNDFLDNIEIDEKELRVQQKKGVKKKVNTQNNSKKSGKVNENSINKTQGKKLKNKQKNKQDIKNKGEKTQTTKAIGKKNISNNKKTINNYDRNTKNINGGIKKAQPNNTRKIENGKNENKVREPKNISSQKNSNNYSRNSSMLHNKNLKKKNIHIKKKIISDREVFEKIPKFTLTDEEYKKKFLGSTQDKQTKMIYIKDEKKHGKMPKSVVFLGVYAFFLSVVMIYSFSRVSGLKVEKNSLDSQIADLSEENTQLDIKLATAYNIDDIRERAENELYMSKPDDNQIVYITVVPENYVEYEMEAEDEQ